VIHQNWHVINATIACGNGSGCSRRCNTGKGKERSNQVPHSGILTHRGRAGGLARFLPIDTRAS